MFLPLGDRVLIRPLNKEQMTSAGIVLPDSAKKESQEGEIIAVGDGSLENGKKIDFNAVGLRPGVKVMYDKFGPDDIEINKEELKVAKFSQILGIVDQN